MTTLPRPGASMLQWVAIRGAPSSRTTAAGLDTSGQSPSRQGLHLRRPACLPADRHGTACLVSHCMRLTAGRILAVICSRMLKYRVHSVCLLAHIAFSLTSYRHAFAMFAGIHTLLN